MRFEISTCPNKMIFIYFEHCASYSRLLRFYSVTRALIPSQLCHIYSSLMNSGHMFGGRDHGNCNSSILEWSWFMREHRVLLVGVVVLCSCSLLKVLQPPLQHLLIVSIIDPLTQKKVVRRHKVNIITHDSSNHHS